jgi:ABC-type glycerol-3-phosphate transport system substrate-binding protein
VAAVCSMVAAGCKKTAAKAEEKAPIEIVAFYPLNADHQFIADYLKDMEKQHPGQIELTIYDMQTPEGRQEWQGRGLTCAGVFVNGSTRHEVTRDGKTETVDFIKKMDVFWTRADFEAVVSKLLEEAKANK